MDITETYRFRRGVETMKPLIAVLAILFICVFGFAPVVQAQVRSPGVVILKGNPMGGVKFDHGAHAKLIGDKCVTCHHASKPERPSKAPQENCRTCHTKTASAPMKTSAKLTFHDGLAKKGICIDCHSKVAASGKKVPLKCAECHQKANV
jgi:hypothetical protein